MKTIFVDDEAVMIRLFERLSRGISDLELTACFIFPEDAAAYAEKYDVELAILDVEMPGMNGIRLAEKLREIRKDILIIFISASDSDSRLAEARGDGFMLKPFNRSALEEMAEKMLAVREHRKQTAMPRGSADF